MKLLYITNQICGSAGLERVLSIKTNYLIEHYGYDIHIVTLNQGDLELFYEFNKHITYHDIKTSRNTLIYLFDYIKGLNQIVKKIKPDIISVCDDGLKGFFVPLTIIKPCPMIYERHVSKNIEITTDFISPKENIFNWLKYKLMHFGAGLYNKFIVLTEDNLSEWSLKNIQVISNPLSFYPKESASLNSKIVLAVGRQSYQKGYDRLLSSWKHVVSKHPDWKLKIYGKINTSLKLKELSESLEISNSVSFHEPIKEISKVYLNSSIYVMSSRFEGFGMVLIEAMSCGVPVVSYDCPCGPKDIITTGKDGLLIPNNDIILFAKGIINLIENENKRKEMGTNAKISVEKYFPEQIVPKWDKLFKNLILD